MSSEGRGEILDGLRCAVVLPMHVCEQRAGVLQHLREVATGGDAGEGRLADHAVADGAQRSACITARSACIHTSRWPPEGVSQGQGGVIKAVRSVVPIHLATLTGAMMASDQGTRLTSCMMS
jgi:hypothetical protein